MHSVKESTRGLIFPQNIPSERGNRREYSLLVTSAVLLLFGYMFANSNQLLYLLTTTSSTFLILGTVELLSRCCSLFEEVQHLYSRYDNRWINLLQDTFTFSIKSTVAFVGSAFIFATIFFATNENPLKIMFTESSPAGFSLLIGALLFYRVLMVEQSPLNSSLQFSELQGCDYGSGMAHSFFHGYLRIMLPHTGKGSDKGLREFQQDYEARNNIKFDVYKLFILIPMSQHCPPSLGSEFSPSVEPSKELESKEVDRAGVKNRNYKNSVYKINTKSGIKKYVTAEYATPVKTLWEVMTKNTPCSKLYMKHRKEILLNFYLTLRDLLKYDADCCDLCEIIYYDDKDEKGDLRDVGEVILTRLQQILKKKD